MASTTGPGDDTITGTDGPNTLYGDSTGTLTGRTGGNDTILGLGGNDTVYGDAPTLSNSRGGNDSIDGGSGSDRLYGDAAAVSGQSFGGNDTIIGGLGADTISAGGGNDSVIGDVIFLIDFRGDPDSLFGGVGIDLLLGDADTMAGSAIGGNDVLWTGPGDLLHAAPTDAKDMAFGDAFEMHGSSRGGSDTLTAGGSEEGVLPGGIGSMLFGDANQMFDQTRGGNDVLHAGGARAPDATTVFGDAAALHGTAAGGNDTITGDAAEAKIYGDGDLYDQAQGGNDRIYYEVNNPVYSLERFPVFKATIFGDGETIQDSARGGNDSIGGSPGNDTIYGDALFMGDGALGGNDTLGGAVGADRFVFVGHFGDDVIQDFHRDMDPLFNLQGRPSGPDKIEIHVPGISSLADLQTTTVPGVGTVITVPGYGSITLPDNGIFHGPPIASDFDFGP
jgi:serralysin